MKKLLLLSLCAATVTMAMEQDDLDELRFQQDPYMIVSLMEAYMKASFLIQARQGATCLGFEKYNYQPTWWNPKDPNPYFLKMNTVCQAISGMSKETKERFDAAMEYYNKSGQAILKESLPKGLIVLQATRLGKFGLNLDLPNDESKKEENIKIVAARQRWENAFAAKDPTLITECLKDLSFASKLPSLQEEEKREKEKLKSMPAPLMEKINIELSEELGDEALPWQDKAAKKSGYCLIS